ncbi:zinc finger MYM-type protein 1-like [Aphis craccivora]|uniref:Zinc finger MYM-type protein 1-like n=1 Tax=Aphis craccivora TaxID=307492 RepID=A0A6G0W3V9_APHCR|nr:zinc finger MYM-type protein 1-like [Aphis craccivora]
MENRFKENQMDIISGLSEMFMSEEPTEDLLKLVSDTYNFNTHDLKTELEIFNRMFNQKYDNTSVSEKLEAKIDYIRQNDIQKGFPLITESLKIFLTIPTNTASCERSFSCLKRLKTYLRTTMGQERLSSLANLQIEKNYCIDFDQVIDE